ncbi:MAG: glycosyltransferase [bacterium]|nr:glycosyltransferase [bacterium]
MFLNVIIPGYRASGTILRTIESVLGVGYIYKGDFDVTVVDSSNDNTADVVAESGFKVNLIKLPEQAYPGKARNHGVLNTKGDVLCFIDADAWADRGWLESIHDHLTKHPDVGAVGGPVLNGNPGEGYSQIAHWCEFSGYGPNAPEGKRRVQPTVNVAIRREVFEKYGAFLEDQFGNEDVLLFDRMSKANVQLHFNRLQRVYHRNKTTIDEINKHQYRLGESTGRARVKYDLPGKILTKPGMWVFIPLIKMHLMRWRILTQEKDEFPKFLASWPRVYRAMLWFMHGFREGVKKAKGEKT